MGISFIKIKPYYKKLKIIFISHEHQDHLLPQTIKKLAELRPTLKFIVANYLVKELCDLGVKKKNIIVLEKERWYDFNAFKCKLTPTVHDKPNVAIHLDIKGEKIFYATDTSTLKGIEARNYNYYFIEANYQEEELKTRLKEKEERGEFAYERRVLSTHLSKQEADLFLLSQMGDNSECIYCHQHVTKEKDDGDNSN